MELNKTIQVIRRFSQKNWGGIESAVLNTCIELNKKKITSLIYCTNSFGEEENETVCGISIRRFKHFYPWIALSQETKQKMELKGGNPFSFALLLELFRDKTVSILHTHTSHRIGGIVRFVARLKKIPYVVTIHSGYLATPAQHHNKLGIHAKEGWEWGKAIGWFLGARDVVQDANAVICVGQDEYVALKEKYPAKEIFYLPNGVDIDFISKGNGQLFRKAHQVIENEKVILCVSRIDPQKNQLLLVKTFSKFVTEFPNNKLFLIGPITDKDYEEQLQKEIDYLALREKCIIIPGYSYGDVRLADAYQAADCFVLPSSIEPFGIVVLEAWAAKKPVISSRVGGIPGFATDEENILFFENNNEIDLLDQLKKITLNVDLANLIATNGFHKVKAEFTWETIVERLIEIYKTVLNLNK